MCVRLGVLASGTLTLSACCTHPVPRQLLSVRSGPQVQLWRSWLLLFEVAYLRLMFSVLLNGVLFSHKLWLSCVEAALVSACRLCCVWLVRLSTIPRPRLRVRATVTHQRLTVIFLFCMFQGYIPAGVQSPPMRPHVNLCGCVAVRQRPLRC